MTCFKKCPVTGEVPFTSEKDKVLTFEDPIGQEWTLTLDGLETDQAAEWWNNTYVPFWEKWVESQKPVQKEGVQFEVGDVVGPTLEWVLWGMERVRIPNGFTTATVLSICKDGGVCLDHSFWEGGSSDSVHPENLRLVSRVQKFTVNDLPEIPGVVWKTFFNDSVPKEYRCIEMHIGRGDYQFIQWVGDEHEAVKQALESPILKEIQRLRKDVEELQEEINDLERGDD